MSPKTINAYRSHRLPLLLGVLSCIIVFVLALVVIDQKREIDVNKHRILQTNDASRVSIIFNDFFDNMSSGLATIARTVNDNGNVENFDTVAQQLIKSSNRPIVAISLIVDSVLKYTYPHNDTVLNKNIFTSRKTGDNDGFVEAYEAKQIKINGPFRSLRNTECVAARLPIFINNSFWGMASIVVSMDEMVKASGINNTNASSPFGYSIAKVNPISNSETFIFNEHPGDKVEYSEYFIPDIHWKLYVYDKNRVTVPWNILILISLLGSIIIGIITKNIFQKPAELQDLVDEKQKKIIETENEFKAIFENAPVGMAIVCPQTNTTLKMNDTFKNIFELESNEIHNSVHIDPINKTFLHEIVDYLLQAQGEQDRISADYHHYKKDGSDLYISTQAFILPSKHAGDFKFVIIVEDKTKKKTFEKQLIESEKRYKALFNESPAALWEEDFSDGVEELSKNGLVGQREEDVMNYFETNPDRLATYAQKVKIISINDTCHQQYKFNSKQELLTNLQILFNNDSVGLVLKKTLAAICERKLKFRSESCFIDANGEQRNSILSWQVIPGHEVNYDQVILATTDITDLKKSRQELKDSMQVLNLQNKRLLEFSYIVSHNLRSHTSNILSLCELIISSNSTEEKAELTAALLNVTNILNNTLEGLNEIVNINSGLNLKRENIQLKNVLTKTINILSEKIHSKKAIVNSNISHDANILYNKSYIESIFLNLISNSLKYSKANTPPIINIEYKDGNSEKILTISDNGIGIDLEKNGTKLFGLFKTFTVNPDSKGIGLYITKRQIESMGGKIEVKSKIDVGTTFKIWL